MPEIKQLFLSGNLKLEGMLQLPRDSGQALPGVALCHPHSLHGGSMSNNVIVSVSRSLTERGIIALRFNFRGVGLSEGTFDDGKGEQDDLAAAITALAARPEVDPDRLGIMGYSFGGLVALAAARSCEKVRALAAVSPVVTPGIMQGLHKPAYIICGAEDQVISTDLLVREAEKADVPGRVELMQGVDHFWLGREKEMAGKVAAFFAGVL